MCDTCQTGGVGNSAQYRTIQEFLGIENVVDLFVLKQTVRMDTGSGHVEIFADKRGSGRYLIADLLLIVLCQLRDDTGIHTVQITLQLCIFEYHCLQRCITGTLTDTKQ